MAPPSEDVWDLSLEFTIVCLDVFYHSLKFCRRIKIQPVYKILCGEGFSDILFVAALQQVAQQHITFFMIQPITLKIGMYMYFSCRILFRYSFCCSSPPGGNAANGLADPYENWYPAIFEHEERIFCIHSC
ncbi:hypothetical protein TNCV_1924251 [Trichonephila clavipes]|nr:hypothetical protein TNCV_1924251 [Trichonephila clavipes]